ncbi:MAG TPA: TonB-dependent receptor [Rhizomicrobium sp.]|jgi:outer membrane receptor protein involved in Fe transport
MRVIFIGLSAALLLTSGAIAPAAAQSTAQTSAGVEEVTVTATRRSEKLSKVPESISAFTTEKMDQLDVKNIGDLVRFTPGVTFDPESKDISIRGVNSSAGDATTGIYIDDTPIQIRALGFGSDNTLPAVFDLERVEILRGPQGTLFGAGSEGGTVRYITPAPSLDAFTEYAKAELSTTDSGAPSYEAGAAVGGPIIDGQLGFRISAWGRRDGGWIDKVDYTTGQTLQSNTNSVNTYVVRASMLWQPSASFSVTPSIFYQNRYQANIDDYWVGLSNPSSGDYKTGTPENMADKDHFLLPSLKVDDDLGDVELISDTSYFNRQENVQDYSGTLYDLSYFQQGLTQLDDTQRDPLAAGHPFGTYTDPGGVPCTGGICGQNNINQYTVPGFTPSQLLLPNGINLPGFGPYKAINYITNKQENFSQEVRLQSTDPNARLTWIVGAFFTRQSQLSVEEINDPQLPALTQYLYGETMSQLWGEDLLPNGDDYINHTLAHERQYAIFANATWAITDALKLQGGARLAHTHFDFTNFSDGAQNFGPLGPSSGKKAETPFTPMVDLTWQINPDDMVYATVSKGYRIGGANPLFPVSACSEITSEPSSYNSDTVLSYEAGTKDKFLDGRLQFSGSVYYLLWQNIQQSVTLPSCGFRYTVNQGAAESKGFDVQGDWLLTDNLDLDFSLGYTDSHYTSTGASAGLILADKGNKLPGSPWTLSLGAQYSTNLLGQDSYFRVDYEFASRESGLTPERDPGTSLFDSGLVPEPATNVVTLRAGMTFGQTDISIFADNLLNAHPQLDLSHQDEFTELFEASTLRPRTIGITATYRN